MGNVEINGASLECFEDGKGEPLVLVHGSASDYRTWKLQRGEFSNQFHVITYSRRYHWPNRPIPEGADYAMNGHVDDLETLVKSLAAGSAHLVGHSYGGFLCLLLAIRSPQLVRTLVLAEPPVVPLFVSNPPKPAEIAKLLATRPRTAISIIKFGATGISPATAAARRGDMEAAIRIFGKAVLGPEAYRRLSDSRREQVRANSNKAEFLGSGFSPLQAAEVRSVLAPTLLVNGDRSPRLFHRLADRLGELLPHSDRVKIPEASHMVHEDNAAAFNGAVLSFLAKHRAG